MQPADGWTSLTEKVFFVTRSPEWVPPGAVEEVDAVIKTGFSAVSAGFDIVEPHREI